MSEMTCPARRPRINPTTSPTIGPKISRTIRPKKRSTQIELALPGRAPLSPIEPEVGLRFVAALDALPSSRFGAGSGSDAGFAWQEVREGVREVFLTLTATIALGLGWAALEAGWANADAPRSGDAAAFETGYASLSPAPR